MANILLVDDEESIIDFVSYSLEHNGHSVEVARTGAEALDKAAGQWADLVILDIMLPDTDGFEVCKQLRARGETPILMLSARDGETDKVLGLELGADDYLTKPFSVRELLARVKAILRRGPQSPVPEVLREGDLVLDSGRRKCLVSGNPVELTAKEFDLLGCLMVNRGLALSRFQLLEAVWGHDTPSGPRTVDSHVKTLRARLRDAGAGDPIETVRGTGYRFREA
ncbi:MAG: response regulator transcription factor [Actinomycetota bacterium]